jgi:hypothetical protein
MGLGIRPDPWLYRFHVLGVEERMGDGSSDRMSPLRAARAFVDSEFPESEVAIVAGSFLRGEDTPTSDLDLLIVTKREEAPFRASFHAFGWPIEAFVHSHESYRWYFRSDRERRIPTLAAICAEGIVVRDTGALASRMREEARVLFTTGPPPLSDSEREELRYGLTDVLDDLIGTENRAEGLFIAYQVAEASAILLLLINQRWIGRGKWIVRALRRCDEHQATRLDAALSEYYRVSDKTALIAFARQVLEQAGGPVFEGFYRPGRRGDTA